MSLLRFAFAAPALVGAAPFLTHATSEEIETSGVVRTGILLPERLASEIRTHFWQLPHTASNWGYWHLKPIRGKPTPSPRPGQLNRQQERIARAPGSVYGRHVFGDGRFIKPVISHVLEQGMARHFAARYVIVSHDIFLGMRQGESGFSLHFDGSSVPQPLEASEDLSLYIPLTRTNALNGGRLGVMPAGAYSVARHTRKALLALRRLAREVGHLDLDRIWPEYHTPLLAGYREALQQNHLARNATTVHALKRFKEINWPSCEPGEATLFRNQQFHFPERTHETRQARDVYIIRMAPVYDLEATCKSDLFGTPANRWLIDTKQRALIELPAAVNISTIPKELRHAI